MKCKNCEKEFEGQVCPECGTATEVVAVKKKKPIYKKWWFWVIVAIVVVGIIGSSGGDGETSTNSDGGSSITQSTDETSNDTTKEDTANKVTVIDFTSMSKAEIEGWASTNKVKVNFSEEYSDSVASGSVISQNKKVDEIIKEGATIKVVISKGKKPSIEYLNALKKAETYSEMMHMSKKAIYNQLTSEYGEKFPEDAAQYAIDNLRADYKENALAKAKTYQQTMSMSKSAIYDQLISEYGEKFTAEEAQYAIDHLDD